MLFSACSAGAPEWFLALGDADTGSLCSDPIPLPGHALSRSQMDLVVPGCPRQGPERKKASWAPYQCLSVPVSPPPPPPPALAF